MTISKKSTALICGASQGIGLALTQKILENFPFEYVFASYRPSSDQQKLKALQAKYEGRLHLVLLDATSADDVVKIREQIESVSDRLDFCINAIGTLTDQHTRPERRISDIEAEALNWSFQVNTVPTLLLAKEFKDLMKKSDSPIFAAISAKVGSISDNRLGGWYSYRISKAALNMAIKTFSLEMYRANKQSMVLAIHPGTTDTNLSAPFVATAKKKYILHTPEDTAHHILKVIENCRPDTHNGHFLSWNGDSIPW